MTPPSVLFAEDDDALRLATTQALELAGFTVLAYERADALLASISGAFDGVVVSDIRMPGMDGMDLLAAVHSIDRDIPLILVTGHGDVPLAVKALKDGAFDFLSKPFAIDHLTASVARALEEIVALSSRWSSIVWREAGAPMVGSAWSPIRMA